MELTPKQARFVEEYLVDRCGAKAAIRAGYAPKNARITASKLLTKANILKAVAVGSEVQGEYTRITAAEVVEGLRKQAFLASEAGQYSAAIRAYELLGKHDGQFTEKMEVKHNPVPVAFVDPEGVEEEF